MATIDDIKNGRKVIAPVPQVKATISNPGAVEGSAQSDPIKDKVEQRASATIKVPVNGNLTPGAVQQNVADPVKQAHEGKIQAGQQKEQEQKQKNDFQSWLDMFGAKTPLTPEQQAEQDRRERQSRMFSAIGDGISAMSNLYFASQGAPNAYNPANTMTSAVDSRWEKLKAEQERNKQLYANAVLKLQDLDVAREKVKSDSELARVKAAQDYYVKQAELAEKIRNNDLMADYRRDQNLIRGQANDIDAAKLRQAAQQFQITSAQKQRSLELQAQRLAKQKGNGTYTFDVGGSSVKIPVQDMDTAKIVTLFKMLPQSVRDQVKGKRLSAEYDPNPVYEKPSTEAMLVAIAENSSTCQPVAGVLKQMAGSETSAPEVEAMSPEGDNTKTKKANPMGDSGKKKNPMK